MSTKFLVLGDRTYEQPFCNLGEVLFDQSDFSKADVIVFTGGADVHPQVYGDKLGDFTFPDLHRDRQEHVLFEYALRDKKPMVGICRGAQLGCALSDGALIQHVTNHTNTDHDIITNDGRRMSVAGDHHQMMYPYDLPEANYKLLAWADGLSDRYLNGSNAVHLGLDAYGETKFPEPEAVYFTKTNFLAIQWHPEWVEKGSESWVYFYELLAKYTLNKGETNAHEV